ncbi:MAG TPA: sugar ABC transporter permease, partial [Tepidisphaeraceae bacterium]|nr:sugar ABC transporter permease [Tepidisphaeraceae bacterium]
MSESAHVRSRWAAYFFVAPFLLGFLLFTLYPLINSVLLSMHQTFGPSSSKFVGLSNYHYLMLDPLFWKALANTFIFAAGSVFIQLPISLALALLLNQPNVRGRMIFRLIFFSPSLIGLVFLGTLAGMAFDKRTGLVDVALHRFIGWNLDYPWLDNHVMAVLILACLWIYAGFNMVYFLAALQHVSKDLLDASTMDGAGPIHRFLHVTIPAIRPVGSFVVLLSLIGSF